MRAEGHKAQVTEWYLGNMGVPCLLSVMLALRDDMRVCRTAIVLQISLCFSAYTMMFPILCPQSNVHAFPSALR